MIESLHKSVDDLRRSREGLQEKVSELQWRSMKNNLVFTGLGNETRDEDTEAKLRDFLRIELNISHHIEFGSVHRFGKYRNDGRRPIVARFIYAQDRTMVKDRGYMLKNKPYGIQEQLPADMSERRRHLLPVMHRLRAEGKRVKLVRDKLIVDGKPYIPDESEKHPEEMEFRTDEQPDPTASGNAQGRVESDRSEISVLSWNIARSLSEKLSHFEFVSIITSYDVICLCECWINPDDEFHLVGYEHFIVPRKIKGGGIVISSFAFLIQYDLALNFQFFKIFMPAHKAFSKSYAIHAISVFRILKQLRNRLDQVQCGQC